VATCPDGSVPVGYKTCVQRRLIGNSSCFVMDTGRAVRQVDKIASLIRVRMNLTSAEKNKLNLRRLLSLHDVYQEAVARALGNATAQFTSFEVTPVSIVAFAQYGGRPPHPRPPRRLHAIMWSVIHDVDYEMVVQTGTGPAMLQKSLQLAVAGTLEETVFLDSVARIVGTTDIHVSPRVSDESAENREWSTLFTDEEVFQTEVVSAPREEPEEADEGSNVSIAIVIVALGVACLVSVFACAACIGSAAKSGGGVEP